MKKRLLGLLILIICRTISYGADSTLVDTSSIADTILYLPGGVGGTAVGVTDSVDYERQLHQNPTLALFKSMLVPGLGQIGNRQYVKAAVVIGLQTWLISSAVGHGNEASDWRQQFDASANPTERNLFYGRYLDSKDQRNKFTWFAVIVTFVSMFDAFSDAHLSGYPQENEGAAPEIDLSFRPTDKNGVSALLTYSF